ncbi:Vegetative incompatibility protein HET-E-1 [Colletotrichum fructicola]|nr:Vegetative incompatibility protein HET-E-1 [Colletotrichum fructicola]
MADSTTLPTYKMYTIGWIVALDNELTAALAMLDETHEQPEDFEQNNKDSNTYSWGQIGDHKIVIASLGAGSYGLVSAATTATCMATSLPHLRIGLMVGIGAGVPSFENDVRLGDVVVSQPRDGYSGVVQYDLGKMRENGHFQRVGALAPPPDVLLKVLNKLKAEQRLKGSKLPQILSQAIQKYPTLAKPKGKDPAFVYQGSENDRLFESTTLHISGERSSRNLSGGTKRRKIGDSKSCAHCDAEGEIERENRPSEDPEIHYGTIASGNLVIKDGAFRDQMTQQLGSDVLCYEMEAAALMNNFPCLVIRGICDYADTHKNDRWQNYAAIVAAAYTRELLEVIEVNGVEKAERIREVMASVSRGVSRIESRTKDTQKAVQSITDQKLLEEIVTWLGAPNPSGNQRDAFEQRHIGTGKWLLESEEYTRWKAAPASSFWLYGMPGSGKTVLSSIIINDLESSETHGRHLLSFYFTFADSAKQSLDGAIRSLIWQLFTKSAAAKMRLAIAYDSKCSKGSKQPSTGMLREILKEMIGDSDEVWIVLDALDECQLRSTLANKGLLEWLQHLLDHKHANLHVAVTSRPDLRIKLVLNACIST